MTWALQDAKSKFSAVAEDAWRGNPQVVTRRGKPLVVVISYELYQSKIKQRKKRNVIDALMDCPVHVDLNALIPPRSLDSGRARAVDFSKIA